MKDIIRVRDFPHFVKFRIEEEFRGRTFTKYQRYLDSRFSGGASIWEGDIRK